jgi:hypothetical protein
VVSRQGCLPLVQVFCIPFCPVRPLCPFGGVKNELPDGHAGIDPDRACIDIGHLKRDGAPEPGIDPAAGLVEGDAEAGNARLAFNGGNDIVGELDVLQRLGKDELAGVEDE